MSDVKRLLRSYLEALESAVVFGLCVLGVVHLLQWVFLIELAWAGVTLP